MTLNNDEVPVMLELWELQRTPSLPLLPGLLWPRVVAPDRVLFMGQIELNCVLMLNWIVWNRTIYMCKNGLIPYNGWWVIKSNQTKNKPNQIKPNQNKPNQNKTKQITLVCCTVDKTWNKQSTCTKLKIGKGDNLSIIPCKRFPNF